MFYFFAPGGGSAAATLWMSFWKISCAGNGWGTRACSSDEPTDADAGRNGVSTAEGVDSGMNRCLMSFRANGGWLPGTGIPVFVVRSTR